MLRASLYLNEGKGATRQTDKKPNMTDLVVDGVKLGEDDSIDQAGLVGHGVVRQGLIKLNLRTWEVKSDGTLDHTDTYVRKNTQD